MREPKEPGLASHEPITDAQKRRIGEALTSDIKAALVYESINGIQHPDVWAFDVENSTDLMDDEGYLPTAIGIGQDEHEETPTTRSYRAMVTRVGLERGAVKTYDYKIIMRKNTQEVLDVRLGLTTPEIIEAIREMANTSFDEFDEGRDAYSRGRYTDPIMRMSELTRMELQSQWDRGECSSSEAEDLISALDHAVPGLSVAELQARSWAADRVTDDQIES
ncbi:MAG TPA: hypothetical protein VFP32_01410 [Candidatus Saccharimonadales bacterium]|nr:hypothetical protein [Candidatus Saccharimonadales bacterium]